MFLASQWVTALIRNKGFITEHRIAGSEQNWVMSYFFFNVISPTNHRPQSNIIQIWMLNVSLLTLGQRLLYRSITQSQIMIWKPWCNSTGHSTGHSTSPQAGNISYSLLLFLLYEAKCSWKEFNSLIIGQSVRHYSQIRIHMPPAVKKHWCPVIWHQLFKTNAVTAIHSLFIK